MDSRNVRNEEVIWPGVSICIITKNHRDLLLKALPAVLKVDYPEKKLQIIVLEETNKPLTDLPAKIDYHTIPERNLGFGFARNEILKFVENEVVVFIDDDCFVDSDWLKKIIHALVTSENAGAVGGGILVPECGDVGKCENILGFPGGGADYIHQANEKIIKRPSFSTCNCAIYKSIIDEIGGFDETMKWGGEDENLSRKINEKYSVYFAPQAFVRHVPRDSYREDFFWFFRRGKAEVNKARSKNNSISLLLTTLMQSPLVRIIVATILLKLLKIPLRLIWIIIATYYIIILRKFKWAIKFYPDLRTRLQIPLVKWTMDTGRDLGVMSELFKKE